MLIISHQNISLGKLLGRGKSCKEIKDSDPSAVTGIYEVDVRGEKIQLVCDMDISGGGWAEVYIYVLYSIIGSFIILLKHYFIITLEMFNKFYILFFESFPLNISPCRKHLCIVKL